MPIFTFNKIMFGAVIACANPSLPDWITSSKLSDSESYFFVCSHDGLDPEEVRLNAEAKCLASAAKAQGVTVNIKQKTVQSLSGVDSSEVAEINPLVKNVKCEFTDRLVEKIENGFRVWLRCKTTKNNSSVPHSETELSNSVESPQNKPMEKYKRATLILTTVPKPDKIIISGQRGERVITPISNAIEIEIKEGDEKVLVKKQKYSDESFPLPEKLKHGDVITKTLKMDREM